MKRSEAEGRIMTPEIQYHLNSGYLTGEDVRYLMREHKTTTRSLALRMQIFMTRVREVRLKGVRGRVDARSYFENITLTGCMAPGTQDHQNWLDREARDSQRRQLRKQKRSAFRTGNRSRS